MENLYFKCLDRMNGADIETSEDYFISCIAYLRRELTGRADKDRIRDDFLYMRGLEKYQREMKLINQMERGALDCLIAVSLDLKSIFRRLNGDIETIIKALGFRKKDNPSKKKLKKIYQDLSKVEYIK